MKPDYALHRRGYSLLNRFRNVVIDELWLLGGPILLPALSRWANTLSSYIEKYERALKGIIYKQLTCELFGLLESFSKGEYEVEDFLAELERFEIVEDDAQLLAEYLKRSEADLKASSRLREELEFISKVVKEGVKRFRSLFSRSNPILRFLSRNIGGRFKSLEQILDKMMRNDLMRALKIVRGRTYA